MSKKNKKHNAANDTPAAKPSLERRGLRMAFKIFGYILFVSYLIWAIPHTKTWADIVWVQRQPVEKLAEITPDYILARRPDKIYTWVKMRKYEDLDKVMEILEPYTAELSPMTFMIYADRLAARNDIAEAVFWYQFALYRMRFDALRCGETEEAIGITFAMNKIYRNDKILNAVNQDKAQLPRTIRAVLDKDAQYPARNHPVIICQIVRGLTGGVIEYMPEKDWSWVRHALRDKSENDLKLLEAEMQQQRQEEDTPDETPQDGAETPDAPAEDAHTADPAATDNETTDTP